MVGVIVRSPAKQRLIDFINNAKMDENYTFNLRGDTQKADAFTQQMRVELSRFRKLLKRRGQIPRDFKVLTISITEFETDQNEIRCTVVLKQSMSGHARVEEQLGDVLSKIARPETKE